LRGEGHGLPAARLLVTLAIVALALVFAIWRFGVPALADFAAERIPPEWEASYGRSMVAEFQKAHPPVDTPALRQPALLVQSALAPPPAGAADRFVILQDDLPNAFALPGGHIVLTTGLLRALRTPDELAAVFAHEWGHVQRRHVLRNIFRQASLQLLLAIVAGDQSALSGALRTAGELGSLSYSRDYEREADDAAMALLAARGTSPIALAEALASIRQASGEKGNTLGFLSTHPAPAERVQRIERAAARMPVHGASGWQDAAAWGAMKHALVGAK
jgi:predicted Zn-dependent protease